jgi:XRN 5'-3' exonuclease N-terminus
MRNQGNKKKRPERIGTFHFTPGMPLMSRLTDHLTCYAATQMVSPGGLFSHMHLAVVSGALTLGEGEFKIFSELRQRTLADAMQKSRHGGASNHRRLVDVVLTADGDAILFALRYLAWHPNAEHSMLLRRPLVRDVVVNNVFNALTLADALVVDVLAAGHWPTRSSDARELAKVRRAFAESAQGSAKRVSEPARRQIINDFVLLALPQGNDLLRGLRFYRFQASWAKYCNVVGRQLAADSARDAADFGVWSESWQAINVKRLRPLCALVSKAERRGRSGMSEADARLDDMEPGELRTHGKRYFSMCAWLMTYYGTTCTDFGQVLASSVILAPWRDDWWPTEEWIASPDSCATTDYRVGGLRPVETALLSLPSTIIEAIEPTVHAALASDTDAPHAPLFDPNVSGASMNELMDGDYGRVLASIRQALERVELADSSIGECRPPTELRRRRTPSIRSSPSKIRHSFYKPRSLCVSQFSDKLIIG